MKLKHDTVHIMSHIKFHKNLSEASKDICRSSFMTLNKVVLKPKTKWLDKI